MLVGIKQKKNYQTIIIVSINPLEEMAVKHMLGL